MTPADAPRLINGISSDAVHKATGRTWDEWFAILDAENAVSLAHPQIAVLLNQKLGAPDWWSQMITVGYELERGLRAKHQQPDGYAVSLGKTVNVPVAALWRAFADDGQRALWLPDAPVSVSKSTEPKSVRMRWLADGSHVSVDFYAKGESKSNLSLAHSRIADAEQAEERKAYWRAAFGALKQHLEA